VSSAKASNIVELRQLLAERFPGVRMEAGRPPRIADRWPTALPQIDAFLDGGLAKSALTEIVSSGVSSGSSLLVTGLIEQAHRNGEWLALIDGADSFDAASLNNEVLSRVLWARCSNPKEAIKAADLLLHDGTIPVTVLDLISCASQQLKKTPSSTWFRLQRLAETASTAFVILTPMPMISNADARLRLAPRFTLDSLEVDRATLLTQITPQPLETAVLGRRIVKIA
jgi:hypothetical protein